MSRKEDEKLWNELHPSPPVRVPFGLRLRTLKSSRNTMARLARSYAKGELDEKVFKNLIWFLGQYINYLKTEQIESFEDRLTAIERILQKPKREVKRAC